MSVGQPVNGGEAWNLVRSQWERALQEADGVVTGGMYAKRVIVNVGDLHFRG